MMPHCTDFSCCHKSALPEGPCLCCKEPVQLEQRKCPHIADGLGMCTSFMTPAALLIDNILQVMLYQLRMAHSKYKASFG